MKSLLPLTDRATQFGFAGPEEIPLARVRGSVELALDEIGQEAVNEYACLLGVRKKFVATDPVHSGLDAVADRYT